MAERGRRPVSETIASGFSANRKAVGPEFTAMCGELAKVAIGQPGVDLYFPVEGAQRKRLAEARVVKTTTVISKAAQLGRLNRLEVYEFLYRSVRSMRESPRVSADMLQSEEDSKAPGGSKIIAIGFDKESGAKLGRENNAIGYRLAELANLGPGELDWPWHIPDLALARVSADTPDSVYDRMRGTVEGRLEDGPIDFVLNPVRLLPRLPDAVRR